MSVKKNKNDSPGKWGSKGGAISKNDHKYSEIDRKTKMEITKKLNEMFRDTFDLELIASVAHTCQWDFGRSAEALMILGGCSNPISRKGKQARGQYRDGMLKNEKTKSLPSSLKQQKNHFKESGSLHSSMPNGLKQNPNHTSSNSLSSGQVWQRHYKSKPQSPGLLTMIPVQMKDSSKPTSSRTSNVKLMPQISPNHKDSVEVKKCNTTIARIQNLVINGMKVLVLMRGVPGSGKTHLATLVVEAITNDEASQHIFSTDDYFVMLGRGTYRYDSNQLPQAHNWNQKRVSEALRRSTNPVIVDNTHCQAWEMKMYVTMAVEHGYLIEVLEPITPWRNKEAELARRNLHFVPREKIRQMLDKYESGWTGDKLLKLFGLNYTHCGKSHVPQEIKSYSNTPLAQHRQHDVIQVPEKPKRRRSSPKKNKKINKSSPVTVDTKTDRERQMEELNKLFAEYGTQMDTESRQRVLQSGVPIHEVVARIRKLQGTVLPLPNKTEVSKQPQPSSSKGAVMQPIKSGGLSPPDSVEPDTLSSSNQSETSEYETDSEVEYASNTRDICEGNYIDNNDDWEDLDDDNQVKSEGAVSSKHKSNKHSSLTTSSQEELSLLDYDNSRSTQPCSSQEELSILDFEDSSSSEEQETQMLTLQESFKEMMIQDNKHDKTETFHVDSISELAQKIESSHFPARNESPLTVIELNDSLLNLIKKHDSTYQQRNDVNITNRDSTSILLNNSLLEILNKKYKYEPADEKVDVEKLVVVDNDQSRLILNSVRSPDLEEIPLPSIPLPGFKPTKLDHIMNSWEDPIKEDKREEMLKPARAKSDLTGTIKKTRDKSPEKVLSNAELSWSSVPFTSSWENLNQKPSKPPIAPKPQRLLFSNKRDFSTNTNLLDFDLYKQAKSDGDHYFIKTNNRDINFGNVSKPESNPIPGLLMLDKGCMTDDHDIKKPLNIEELTNKLKQLAGIFPHIPHDNLIELLDKCNGDVTWVVDLLLESSSEGNIKVEKQENASNMMDSLINQISSTEDDKTTLDMAQNLENIVIDGKKTIKRGKKHKISNSDLSQLLKKQLEENITINAQHYSDKTLYIKKLRHGEFGDDVQQDDTQNEEIEEEREASEGDNMKEVPEETIAMELNPQFLNSLVEKFGFSYIPISQIEGYKPTVNIPISLANQIYSCWLESINEQIEELETHYDKMVREDALFAMEVQKQEFEQKAPDLREIMDMEMALSLYKEEQCTKSVQDTVASKLSKKLLFDTFPNIDKTALVEIYKSQGGSFQKTYDILKAYQKETPVNVIASEFLVAQERSLLEEARQESLKAEKLQQKKPVIVVKNPKEKSVDNVLVADPSAFRQEIHLLHKRRNDCYERCQEAFRSKNYPVASYYSQMTSLYKERIQQLKNNSIPVKMFDDDSLVTTQLDLHYLFVSEAVQILDLFLDHHINKLRDTNKIKMDITLITGRGLHSRAGISRIKPAVGRRLAERGLESVEVNPGLLQVTVRKNNMLTNDL